MHCYLVTEPEEYSWFSSLSMCVCYSLILYTCKNIIEDYVTTKSNSNNLLNDLTTLSNFTLSSIKESHDDTYKQKMFQELLDINSLERCYILYFIFKRKGSFKSMTSIEYINNELTTILTNTYINNIDTKIYEEQDKKEDTEKVIYEETDIETEEETETDIETEKDTLDDTLDNTLDDIQEFKIYNSYELYNKIMNKLDLDLDETSIPDIKIRIGDNIYELTLEKLHFIQWMYYIGLYDYLTDIKNIDIKYDILHEMSELGLLTGNIFLRYQLFLCDYEYEKKLSLPKLN